MEHGMIQNMGQEIFAGTPLQRLRRNELHKIAKAYDIMVKPDCNKSKILPVLEEAQTEGVFSLTDGSLLSKAKNPWFLTGEKPPQTTIQDKTDFTIEWMGVSRKHCIMNGDTIVQSKFKTKEDAELWLTHS